MRRLLTTLSLLAVPSVALAQAGDTPPPPTETPPPPPTPAPTPPPTSGASVGHPMAAPVMQPMPSSEGGGPPDGWMFQARIPTGLGLDTILSPGLVIAHRAGKMAIGGELGVIGGKFTTNGGGGASDSTQVLLISAMGVLYDELWTSPDGKARFGLVGGLGYGHGSITTDSNDGMGGTNHTESTASYLTLMAGLGGDYYLHPNFALGVELSAEVPILLSADSNGQSANVSGNLESLHGIFRATFIVGP